MGGRGSSHGAASAEYADGTPVSQSSARQEELRGGVLSLVHRPWQTLREREVMMLLELQRGGFQMLKLLVEKGLQQVNCIDY